MVTKCFAVFDSKAGCFGTPIFLQSAGLAIRSFTDVVNDGKSTISKYPADFSIHEIGSFDDNTGVLSPLDKHINLGLATSFVSIVPKEVSRV